jgi:molybdopterin-containing oxidoreductase family iron-sulfur binding subunit
VPSASPQALEASFHLDASVLDGRYAGNGWLQELPDPITRLSWDNAACLAPSTAAALGLRSSDLVELTRGSRSVRAPVLIVPGIAPDTVVLPLGYGQKERGAEARVGFDVSGLRSARAPWFEAGLTLKRLGGRHPLAMTQEQGSAEGRPLIRETTIDEYGKHPDRVAGQRPGPRQRALRKDTVEYRGRQWGMSIDLSLCTGCGACVVACQAENNIPVVGRRRVMENREMHWLRVDRYFGGSDGDPQVRFQPLPCMHCELAPCEKVCPVKASAHSADGLNDQVYSRCIGARRCSKSCPFKVRRFNFLEYNKDTDPLLRMQKNPDVTLRFRGVMEKCSYCVQRIQEARIRQKVKGTDLIPDGMVMPACAQTCPSGSIVFGDINDENSLVAHRKREPRSYVLLPELNLWPRTSYLAKLRNPNPELA